MERYYCSSCEIAHPNTFLSHFAFRKQYYVLLIQNNIFIVIEHNLKYHLSLFLWSTSLVFLRLIAKHSVLRIVFWVVGGVF